MYLGEKKRTTRKSEVKRSRAIVFLHYFPPTVFRPLLPCAAPLLAINVFSSKEAGVFLFQEELRVQPELLPLLREEQSEEEKKRDGQTGIRSESRRNIAFPIKVRLRNTRVRKFMTIRKFVYAYFNVRVMFFLSFSRF